MKKIFSGILAAFLMLSLPCFADNQRLTQYPDGNSTMTSDDLLYVVDNPAGTPTSKKISAYDFLSHFNISNLAHMSSFELFDRLSDKTGTGQNVFSDSPVFTTQIVDPVLIGGTDTTSSLTIKPTSSASPATGADIIVWSGGAEYMRILNTAKVGYFGNSSPVSLWDFSHQVTSTTGNAASVTINKTAATSYDGSANTGTDELLDNTYEAIQFIPTGTSAGYGSIRLKISSATAVINPTDTITFKVYGDSGGTPVDNFGGATVSQSYGRLTTSYQDIDFAGFGTFTAGNKYWLVMSYTTAPTGATVNMDCTNTGTATHAYSSDGSSWTLENNKSCYLKYYVSSSARPLTINTLNGDIMQGTSTSGGNGADFIANGHNGTAAVRGTSPMGFGGNFTSTTGTGVNVTGTYGTALATTGLNTQNTFTQTGTAAWKIWKPLMSLTRSVTIGAFDCVAPLFQLSSTVADTGNLMALFKQNAEKFKITSNGTAWLSSGYVADETSLGSEKATNGTFTGNANNWTLNTGWAYNSNNVIHTSGNTGTLTQDMTEVAGDVYYVSYVVSSQTIGTVTMSIGGVTGKTTWGNGTFTEKIEATGTGDFSITPSTDFNGIIDTISVKKITGGNIRIVGGFRIDPVLVANLPAAASNTNLVKAVSDAASSTDCTTGLGSTYNLCISNGSAWVDA